MSCSYPIHLDVMRRCPVRALALGAMLTGIGV